MSKIYECTMTETLTFNLKADNDEQAQDWLQTHSIKDVQKETTLYDINYAESVHDEVFNEDYGIDISSDQTPEFTVDRAKELINSMIDDMVNIEGCKVRPVIKNLLGIGFTENELVNQFNFSESDVQDVIDGEYDEDKE